MKIKLKKDCQIPEKSGWCFLHTGFDQTIIEKLNNGETVEVDKIHQKSIDLVSKIEKTKKES
jgi:hypothetical protein